jgi:hypothetical protein
MSSDTQIQKTMRRNELNNIQSNSIYQFHSRQLQSVSQSTPTVWARTFGGERRDEARFIIQTSDGGYLVLGQTQSFGSFADVWFLKLKPDGSIEWQQRFNESARLSSFQETSDGGFIVSGIFSWWAEGGRMDLWVFKLNSDGSIAWQRAFGGNWGEMGHFVQQTSDGGYVVIGLTTTFTDVDGEWWDGAVDVWFLKLNPDGSVDWQRRYGGLSFESDWANETRRITVQETSDSGYIFITDTSSFGAGWTDIWVVKVNSDGDIEWQKTYGGQESEWLLRSGPHIQQTPDGGYIFTCYTLSFGVNYSAIWVVKLNPDGSIDWQRLFDGGLGEGPCSIHLADGGGYFVAGSTNSFSENQDLDFWLLKLKLGGDIEWQKTYGGRSYDEAFSFQQTSDGGCVITGNTFSFGAGDSNIWVVKVNSDGNLGPGCGLAGISDVMVTDTSVIPVDTNTISEFTPGFSLATDVTVIPTSSTSEINCWDLVQSVEAITLEITENRGLFRGEFQHKLMWENSNYNEQNDIRLAAHIIGRKREGQAFYEILADDVPGNVREYTDIISDTSNFSTVYVYAIKTRDVDGNISPWSSSVSTANTTTTVFDSGRRVRESSSTRVEAKNPLKLEEAKRIISKPIIVNEEQLSLVQPLKKIQVKKAGDDVLIIWWKHSDNQSVERYNVYVEDDDSYRLLKSVPGYINGCTVHVSDLPVISHDEENVFVLTAVYSNGNGSPEFMPFSADRSIISVSQLKYLSARNTESEGSNTRISLSESSKSHENLETKLISLKDFLINSIITENSPVTANLIYKHLPPINPSVKREGVYQAISWEGNPLNRDLKIRRYNIYRKTEGEDEEKFRMIGSVSKDIFAYVDYVPNSDEKYVYAVTSVDVEGNESSKSQHVKNRKLLDSN